jgi:anti-sigma regulatory factor (Ser/Thr protein kinase)
MVVTLPVMEKLLELELPRERTCGVLARRAVEAQAGHRLPETIVDDLKLLVTELVDNAYLHGSGRIWLSMERDAGRLRVEVVDEGEGAAVKVNPAPSGKGGYGLKIVERLSETWGAYEGTTHVWAELSLPDA